MKQSGWIKMLLTIFRGQKACSNNEKLLESLQCLQVGKKMSTGALKKYLLDGLFKTNCLVG
jgi:hypothetical protein